MAEKKIMYRQRTRKVFGEEKYVVGFVPRGTISLHEIAQRISRDVTVSLGEIEAYLEEVMAQTKFSIAEGTAVNMGDLGTFYLKTHCKFVENEEDVAASNIDRLNVGFRPSPALRKAMRNGKLERYQPAQASTSKKGGKE